MLRSQMQALPSVAPVTAIPGPELPVPVRSMKVMASMLSPSVCPPRVEAISPLLRLMTRTPPPAPPTTARVEDGFTAIDVMPSRLNRASSGPNLKTGAEDRGSQNIRYPSWSAVMILFPDPDIRTQILRAKKQDTNHLG